MTATQTAVLHSDARAKTVAAEILDHKWMLRISAVLAIFLGILAILMPWVATFAANLVFGAILAGQGIVDAVMAFKARSTKRIAGKFLLGLVSVAAGILFFLFPVFGVLSLTIWLAMYFAVSSLIKGYWAFKLRPAQRWGWMLFSAVVGLAIAVLIIAGLPTTAFWVLGLFLGIDLIFLGAATLALIPQAKDLAEAETPHDVRQDVPLSSNNGAAAGQSQKASDTEALTRQPVSTDEPATTRS